VIRGRKPEPRRRKDGERRRDELLTAALACFDERGVLSVGIEDIRRKAGASPSSVYNLFRDIDAIMLALLGRVFDQLFAHIAARVCRTRSAEGAVRALVDAHMEWIVAHPREGKFMYQAMTLESAGLTDETHEALVARKGVGLAPIVEHFAPFIQRGELPAWSPTLLDVVLLGPAHEALRRWLAGSSELDPVMLRKTLPALAWKSVR
jgi:AcrR family transcriptional regulator